MGGTVWLEDLRLCVRFVFCVCVFWVCVVCFCVFLFLCVLFWCVFVFGPVLALLVG